MRWQPTALTGVLVLAAAAVSLLSATGGLLLTAAVLIAAAVDGALARAGAPVVTREPPPFVVRGVPARFDIEGPPDAELRQPGTSTLAVSGDPPGPLTLVAGRRGRHELPAVLARRAGPMGLTRWSGPVTPSAPLVVHPDVVAARRLARTATTTTFDEEAGRARGPLGLGTSFESLRDYRPDDDVRLVNWKASARAGKPIVNQFRLEQARDVIVLLDAGRLMTAAIRGPSGAAASLFDAAVDAATALALTADAIGDRCGLVAFADAPLATLAPRTGGGTAVARVAAALDARPVDVDFDAAFRALPSKRSLAVILTDLGGGEAVSALQAAVPILSRRHQVLVVTAEDEALASMVAGASAAASGREAIRRTNRAVAAATLLEERALARRLLQRAGARVVSARPDRLAASACAGYLELKGRARA